jgi:hypothetical protein
MAGFIELIRSLSTSLRATGSRECAPDDKLREAIHVATQRKNGLLRYARNDGGIGVKSQSIRPQLRLDHVDGLLADHESNNGWHFASLDGSMHHADDSH